MPTVFKLIIEDDEGKTTVYPLAESELLIGRKDGNTIRLMERNVSRRHARVVRKNGAVFIEDLDSYNGVRINGERINGRYEVKEGDLVEIGDFHLALQAAEVEEADDTEAGLAPTHKPSATGLRGGPRDSSWPTVGTVPDFRLPADLARSSNQSETTSASREADHGDDHRSTVVDRPVDEAAAKAALNARTNPQTAWDGNNAGAPALPPFPRPAGSILTGGADVSSASAQEAARANALTPQEKHISLFPTTSTTGDSRGDAPSGDGQSHEFDGDRGEDRDDRDRDADRGPRTDQVARSARSAAPGAAAAAGAAGDGASLDARRPKSLARVAAEPRLICVSTSYAGESFALKKPETVIGRVDDNDIVIEHRSVSRSHAKILFDGKIHKVIDLQSANGILVNGEEYAMTDLRARDLIELGHVRFRFLPAGEPYSPTAEEREEIEAAGVELVGGAPAPAPVAASPASASPGALASPSALAAPSVPQNRGSGSGFSNDAVAAPYDPSMAATVTDTPLSALGHDAVPQPVLETRPSVGAPRSTPQGSQRGSGPVSPAGHGAGAAGAGTERGDGSDRDPTSASGASTFGADDRANVELDVGLESDGRITERGAARPALDESPTMSAKPRNPMAGARQDSYAVAPAALPPRSHVPPPRSNPRRPKQGAKFPVYLLVVVGVLLLGVAFLVMTFAPTTDARLEARIQSLYEGHQFEELLKLCADRKDRLSIEAAHLCGRADALVNPPELNQADAPPADHALAARRGLGAGPDTNIGRSGADLGGLDSASDVGKQGELGEGEETVEGGEAGVVEGSRGRPADLSQLVGGTDVAAASGRVSETTNPAEDDVHALRKARRLNAERRNAQRRMQAKQERLERAQRENAASESRAQRESAAEMYEQGMKRFLSGDSLKAERQFLQCVDLVPDFGDCHRGLGAVYRQRGQKARAVEAFRRYLAISPRASDAQQVRDAIRDLDQD
ncbi:MAG: FHA domain-containing protein [Deltaproteobacteria bacterium]|nr:FHA domain-containing protein [Deltaproteobacteria bacterium]